MDGDAQQPSLRENSVREAKKTVFDSTVAELGSPSVIDSESEEGKCDPQVARLRWLLLSASILTMLLSFPLWLERRSFPLLPVMQGVVLFPPPFDALLLAITLAAAACAFGFPRPSISIFLLCGILLVIEDQNRFQPWFYLYWVLLCFTLLPCKAGFAGARLAFSAVYFWAGVQKINPLFFREVVPFFAAPLGRWLPSGAMPVITWGLYSTPAIEIFIALALWIPLLRRAAIAVCFAMHFVSLLALGPSGVNFNHVVWPWNITMPLLAVFLFPPAPPSGLWRAFFRSWPALLLSVIFCLTPILSFRDWWDSYPSFRLYSGNTPRATILLSARTVDALPERIKKFTAPAAPKPPPNWQGPYTLDFRTWAEAELGVPPLPENRSYRRIAQYLTQWRTGRGDVRLILQPRNQRARIEEPE
jgi:hypothetical protein